jgi:lipoprotein-releasing system permease protein
MLFIAKRIYRGGELGKVSTSAVRIATIGVAVGIMIMVISLCVTSGFQSEIKSKVASLIGHVQIVNNQSLYRTQTHPIQITDSLRDRLLSIPEVERVQRFALCRGMLKTDNAFRGVLLRGVDADFDTTFISIHLIEGCMPSFGATSAPSDSIVLPARLARVLELCAGDRVYAYFFDENLRARRFYVSGIYETNMADFDSHMCYVDSRVAQKLSQWQSDQFQGAEIVLKNPSDMHRITDTISSLFQPRFDAYGQFYAVCTVEDILTAQAAVRDIHLSASVRNYIVRLAKTTRESDRLQLGISPRASLALAHASQAWAAMHGRDFVLPDDVKEMVIPVLAHRVIPKMQTSHRSMQTAETILAEITAAVPAPIE